MGNYAIIPKQGGSFFGPLKGKSAALPAVLNFSLQPVFWERRSNLFQATLDMAGLLAAVPLGR
jgi:hypothetical protein